VGVIRRSLEFDIFLFVQSGDLFASVLRVSAMVAMVSSTFGGATSFICASAVVSSVCGGVGHVWMVSRSS
jgi:hypothetical protein